MNLCKKSVYSIVFNQLYLILAARAAVARVARAAVARVVAALVVASITSITSITSTALIATIDRKRARERRREGAPLSIGECARSTRVASRHCEGRA